MEEENPKLNLKRRLACGYDGTASDIKEGKSMSNLDLR